MSSPPNATAEPNGTVPDPQAYDPSLAPPYWHQNMELATICVTNALTLLLIITRVTVRWRQLKRFRADDIWIMIAGLFLVFPYWVSQLGTNRYGSGLHVQNLPNAWLVPFFEFEWGWVGYYLVSSMIKVSVCVSMLEILPAAFVVFRGCVYALCAVILGLGMSESLVWLFQCQPFLSNFVYSIEAEWCLNIDSARYAWVGVSIVIDLCIVCIPFTILRQIRLKAHERMVLLIVFGANLLGTITCAFGIYGIWLNRNSNASADLTYSESVFIMTSDIEIFMYTFGASATMLSRYFINKAAAYSSDSRTSSEQRFSWYHEPSNPSNPFSTGSSSTTTRGWNKRSHGGSHASDGFDLVEHPTNSKNIVVITNSARTGSGGIGVGGGEKRSGSNSQPVLYDLGGLTTAATSSPTKAGYENAAYPYSYSGNNNNDDKNKPYKSDAAPFVSDSYGAEEEALETPTRLFFHGGGPGGGAGEEEEGAFGAHAQRQASGPIWDWDSRHI